MANSLQPHIASQFKINVMDVKDEKTASKNSSLSITTGVDKS